MRTIGRFAQQGLTLIELLVALVLSSLITLTVVALYSVSISSFRTVDAAQELQDSGRFAMEIIAQSVRQAGYQNYKEGYGLRWNETYKTQTTLFPTVRGANNARVTNIATASDDGTSENGGINSSDTLALRFHGSSLGSDRSKADGSMIDCQGVAQTAPAQFNDLADVGLSLFWVANDSSGEPSLACISRGNPEDASATRNSQTLVRGVESFQVMYGVDTDGNTSPERWVSAGSVTDWTQVSALRVGFILRSAPGASQGTAGASATADENKLYPLGKEFTGTSTDAGLVFTPPNDGRIRRAFNATFTLRNPQF